ncbi:MAG: hypothetical protein IPN53_10595 [Comamonadaceae bacterium]|nr:hypothetical protein [Comamonadaceae bacterium]
MSQFSQLWERVVLLLLPVLATGAGYWHIALCQSAVPSRITMRSWRFLLRGTASDLGARAVSQRVMVGAGVNILPAV